MDTGKPSTHTRRSLKREGAPSVASMVESIIGCKWSVRLLELCANGHRRPSELLRSCPGLSAKVMNERLRKMIRFGILQRVVRGEKPPIQVDYLLTPFGHRFLRILDEVFRLQQAVDTGTIPVASEAEIRIRCSRRSKTLES